MAGSYHAVNQLEIPLIIPNVRIRTPAYPGLYTFLLKLLFPTNFQNCLVFSLVRFLAEGKKDRSSAGSYPTPFKAFMWENESALHNHSIKKPILFQNDRCSLPVAQSVSPEEMQEQLSGNGIRCRQLLSLRDLWQLFSGMFC